MREDALAPLRRGAQLSTRQQILLTLRLSIPAILAQLSTIVMQYIDASMVGHMGASESAAIGLVSTSTWLFGGLTSAVALGFTVQVAQLLGAGEERSARNLVRQALAAALALSLLLAGIGAAVAGPLPVWLRAGESIRADATAYFRIFALSLPLLQLSAVGAGMLQASGNMRTPSILMVLMCALDVVFNALLIFPGRVWHGIPIPGAGLGVAGAALGTAGAQAVDAVLLLYFLLRRSPMLHLRRDEPFRFVPGQLRRALHLTLPAATERVVMCSAQIVSTAIIAPLGTVALAAHSFAITAEGLCYMPGYGIQAAASTLVGQSVGARRHDLTYRLGWLTTLLGMAVMALTAAILYAAAPLVIGILTPDAEVVALGSTILRIVTICEPLFGVAIVASGVFQGAGKTVPSMAINFASMWLLRIPLTALLTASYGLVGTWIGMTTELCARGGIFLLYLAGKRWLPAGSRGGTQKSG